MSDLQKLADSFKAFDDDLIKCMRCGFCQNHCPVYTETKMEFDVSRGKVALLSGMADKLFTDAKGMAERLERCLLCGSCSANCPSGTPSVELFIQARKLLGQYLGLSPIKKVIFRALLPNPKGFSLALKASSFCQGLVFRKNVDSAQETSSIPLLKPFLGDRHIRPLASKSLHEENARDSLSGLSGLRVAFFPGCMVDHMYVSVGEACLKVLDHHSVGVFLPENFACCGIPSLASGDHDGFNKQLQQNLDVLYDVNYDYLITPCGSCTSTIKEYWHKFGVLTPQQVEKVKEIAAKTMDINQFLVDVLGVKKVESNDAAVSVTYHDSCHLKKSLNVSSQPRELICASADYKLTEMEDSDKCCGCGGSFNIFHYDLSKKIGERKRKNIVNTGAEIVATSCPACMMQLNDTLSKNSDEVRVKHSIELYAESL